MQQRQAHIKTLCSEYLTLCDAYDECADDAERARLSADRTWTHDSLIELLGAAFDRPFDMKAYARSVVGR